MDKKMKLTVGDIEVEVKMSEEDFAKLSKAKESKKTGYERVDRGQGYFTVGADGQADCVGETRDNYDDNCYNIANYYSNATVAQNNARADELMRQLRRFAAENCEELTWDCKDLHFQICYDYDFRDFVVWASSEVRDLFAICFDSKETAQKAIDEFKDELIWYFTEYRDRV